MSDIFNTWTVEHVGCRFLFLVCQLSLAHKPKSSRRTQAKELSSYTRQRALFVHKPKSSLRTQAKDHCSNSSQRALLKHQPKSSATVHLIMSDVISRFIILDAMFQSTIVMHCIQRTFTKPVRGRSIVICLSGSNDWKQTGEPEHKLMNLR